MKFDGSASHAVAGFPPKNAPLSKSSREVSTDASKPLVAILLCTYQGTRYLAEQLDSMDAQDHRNFIVWASDDNSKDDTHHILQQYQSSWGRECFSIRSGPQEGLVANFLSLTCNKDIQADYYAYADQDDIWEPDKLSRAIAKLEQVPNDVPALYGSRTRLIDENGRNTGFTPLYDKPPSFANALAQNIFGGNTMVMNNAAREVLLAAGKKEVVYHDWWAYILITAAGGTVFYDPYPAVRYRQHDSNILGSSIDWHAQLLRIRMLLKGRYQNWNTMNTQALQEVRHLLTPENQNILDEFCAVRNRWLIPRLLGIWKSGIHRQTFMGNLGLIAAALLKKL